ncbi:Hsp20/alpha crystallin family protein [Haloplanus aerogenes]|uniref:HSP20 family protein n=1 Tax=Haloplanus aerogenes TaxID=660522 RepID=A0A3M0DTL8_9EURY|nr:Hsp20/alpha crystallin family protein [Haloplanus aerogenes]AZH25651.1 Hsp20/alpha crystallin family protein [Haloplanus aerogenes]RMB25379.1 HSP20 family protein [Haloplanus aerogenes]
MSKRNPFDELDELFDRMQANMEKAARMWDPESLGSELPGASAMSIDLEDRGDELVLTGDLPGFETEDIDVRVKERTLHIAAERDETAEEESGEYVRRERRRTSVSRSIPLPSAIDTDGIAATYNNGVLTVRMPKTEPSSEGTRIDVN